MNLRRAPSIDALIAAMYPKGVSTSSFPEALAAIVGEQVSELSPPTLRGSQNAALMMEYKLCTEAQKNW